MPMLLKPKVRGRGRTLTRFLDPTKDSKIFIFLTNPKGKPRPNGTVDTSALAMDTASNPGTMNAIINFMKPPQHQHEIMKWRKAATCASYRKNEKKNYSHLNILTH
jgi:hypothetical protein